MAIRALPKSPQRETLSNTIHQRISAMWAQTRQNDHLLFDECSPTHFLRGESANSSEMAGRLGRVSQLGGALTTNAGTL